jgi:small subunit ribosomal protein S2e
MYLFIIAKATYAAIAKTYAYLTPDLWKEMPLTKPPYQEFADFLAKNHRPVGGQRES